MSDIMSDFIKKMDTSDECLELFKRIILSDYLFKKKIYVYDEEYSKIEPSMEKNINDIIITYFYNSIKINNHEISYSYNSHFTINSQIIKITGVEELPNPPDVPPNVLLLNVPTHVPIQPASKQVVPKVSGQMIPA